VGDLSSGAKQLAAGQKGLADGLTTLYKAVDMLPASVEKQLDANADYQALLGALEAIIAGVGNPTDITNPATGQPATLLGGVNAIKYGLTNPMATDAACAAQDTTKCGATDALDLIVKKLNGALMGPATVDGTVAKLKATILSIATVPACAADALCVGTVNAIADGVADAQISSLTELRDGVSAVSGGIKTRITDPGAGADRLKAGLSNGNPKKCAEAKATADPSDDCGIKEAAQAVRAGVPVLVNELVKSIEAQILDGLGKPTKNCDPTETLRCAAGALAHGGEDLVAGVNTLVAGVQQLNAGGMQLSAGAGELASGLGDLQDGAGQLADGTGKAADGANQVADGANKLATGLGDAADGSGKLADGLDQAAEGAPKIRDGAQRLSDEGTSKLVEAGESTAQNYGEMYATIAAGAERAQTEKMVYGAPDNAIGLAAYSYEIKGEDGAAGRNLAKGLGAMALLGAGAGAFMLRRRIV
jgi:putative membrane protein